ncbi:hypothetical protein ACLB2K_031419 [Fragaria x ananassa]
MVSIDAVTASFTVSLALVDKGKAPDLGKIGGGHVKKSNVVFLIGKPLTRRPVDSTIFKSHFLRTWMVYRLFRVQERAENLFFSSPLTPSMTETRCFEEESGALIVHRWPWNSPSDSPLQSSGLASSTAPKKKKSVILKERMASGTLTTKLVTVGREEHELGSKPNEPLATEDLVFDYENSGSDLQEIPAVEITTMSDESVSTLTRKRGRDRGITASLKKFKTILEGKVITLQLESLGLVEDSKDEQLLTYKKKFGRPLRSKNKNLKPDKNHIVPPVRIPLPINFGDDISPSDKGRGKL